MNLNRKAKKPDKKTEQNNTNFGIGLSIKEKKANLDFKIKLVSCSKESYRL
jgi:hypothetical protein